MGFFNRKKDKVDEDEDFDLDDFDFDGGDFDMEDMGSRKPSKKDMAKEVTKATGKAVGKRVASDAMSELIPHDFEYNMTEIKDLVNESKDIMAEGLGEVKKGIISVLPKKLREKWGEETDSYKRPNEKEMQEASIQNSLDEIFSKTSMLEKTVTKAGDIKGEGVTAALQGVQNKIFVQMSNDISKLTGFFTTVGTQYYRKSLEMQYKTYYLHLDALTASTTFNKGFASQLDKIIKNTSLPEHVKITNAERFEGYMKQNLIQNMYSSAFTNSDLINRFKSNFRSSIKNKVADTKDFFDMIVNFRDSTEDSPEMRMGMFANMIGSFLGDNLGGRISNRVVPRLKEKYGEDRRLKWLGNSVANFVQNTGSSVANARVRLKDRLEAAEGADGPLGQLSKFFYGGADKLLGMFDRPGRERKIKKDTIESLSKAAIFDRLSHRSLTEVIPMYLSKILHENKELRSMYGALNRRNLKKAGYTEGEVLRYNVFKRTLTNEESIKNDYEAQIKKSFNKNDEYDRLSKSMIQDASKILSVDNKLSKKESIYLNDRKTKDGLSDYLKFASNQEGVTMNYETLFGDINDPKKINPKLIKYLESNPRVKRSIELINKTRESEGERGKNFDKTFDSRMETVKSDYPSQAVKVFFDEVADIAGGTRPDLTITQAEVIAKAFTDFMIINRQERLSIDFKTFERAFGYIDPAHLKSVSGPIMMFSRYFRQIVQAADMVTSSELNKAIGDLDTQLALKVDVGKGVDKVLETYQSVYDMDAGVMGGIDELGSSQIVDKSLKNDSVTHGLIDTKTLYELTRPDGETVRALTEKMFDIKLPNSLASLEGIGDRLKEAKDNAGGSRLKGLLAQSKIIFDASKEVVKASYNEAGDLATKIADAAQKLTVETADLVMKEISGSSKALVNKVAEMKQKQQALYEEELKRLEAILKVGESRTNQNLEKIQKDIEKLKERHVKKTELFKKVEESIGGMNDGIQTRLENYDKDNVVSSVESFRNKLAEKLGDLKSTLKMVEELEDK